MKDYKESPKSLPEPNVSKNIKITHKPSRAMFAQVLATLIQNWLLIDIGLMLSMPTLVIGALHRNSFESELNMNDDEASWFGSIPSFCHPIGSLASGYFQEIFGRKGGMIIVNIPIFVSWSILAYANSISTLYGVSIVVGLCVGLSEAPLHSYIGEIGEPHLRGTLSTISTSAAIIGFAVSFVLGYLFEWRTVALICSACPVVTLFSMTQLPESPSWLIVRDRLEDAKKSLCWLRGWVEPEEVEEEFRVLVEYTQNSGKQSQTDSDTTEKNVPQKKGYLKTELEGISSKKVLLPLRMVFIVFVIKYAASLTAVRPFLIHELNDLGTPVDSKIVLIVAQVLFFMGAMANVIILRRFGKRNLALCTYSIAAACISGIGFYSSSLKNSTQFPIFIWIPAILFSIIYFLCGLCVVLLPWQLVSEVFPLTGRGTATGIAAAWAHIVDFIAVKSFLYLEAWLNLSGVMYVYAACSVFGVVYFYFHLPETEGKTLEQIESYFTKNHDRKEKFSMGKVEKVVSP